MSERLAPAQTYELNVLASAIGRFAVSDIDAETVRQANTLTDRALQRLHESDGPELPATMPELVTRSAVFDEKLHAQLVDGPASELMDGGLKLAALSTVTAHQSFCAELLEKRAPHEQMVEPNDIAESYGLPTMWRDAPATLSAEVEIWGEQTQHPSVPPYLARHVSATETEKLMSIIWEYVLMIDESLSARVYTTAADRDYHLFWTPVSDKLDYATPSNYDRAIQLSFDLPHNVAHLAHLSALESTEGAYRFTDRMEERAYFEAVAVLSEYVMAQTCSNHPERIEKMIGAYNLSPDSNSISSLSQWIAEDRAYEFKLRAARLYADMLATQGAPFRDIVSEVSDKLGLSESATVAEAEKYLPWTGLGAVYTAGYRKLLDAGISTVPAAIIGNKGPITTWTQFDNENGGGDQAAI